MKIEDKPYYQTKKYFGKIWLPTVDSVITEEDGSICFSIDKIVEEIFGEGTQMNVIVSHKISYHVHILVKTLEYTPIRGKLKRYITNCILEQIKNEKIIL